MSCGIRVHDVVPDMKPKQMDTPKVRRIELFALPFLIGTAASAALRPEAGLEAGFAASAAFLLCSAVLFADLLTIKVRGTGGMPVPLTLATAALCAAVCVFRSDATSLTAIHGTGRIGSLMQLDRLCVGFRAAVDAIPLTDSENNALLKALLTGDRSALSPGTVQAFRDSGAAHILALSGLHLGIIYGIVVKGLCILGNSPAAVKFRSMLTVAACGGYCLMVGAAPSISRAFLFILLRETARLTGRTASLRDTLWGAFVLQVCIDAGAVRSLSFQLSYLAIAGIAYIYPVLSGLWPADSPKRSSLRWIWNSVSLSVSCQLTTGPLACLRFGTFPKYFIMTNLLSLPLTGVLIPAALATTLLNAAGLCPRPLIQATDHLATLLRQTLEIIAAI